MKTVMSSIQGHTLGDVQHLPGDVLALDKVTVLERKAPQQQNTGEKILEDVFKGETHGDGDDPHGPQGIGRLEAGEDHYCSHHNTDDPDTDAKQAHNKLAQRVAYPRTAQAGGSNTGDDGRYHPGQQ